MTQKEYSKREPWREAVYRDKEILGRAIVLVDPKPSDVLLDIGKNAGATALAFCGKVSKVVAIDQRVSTTEKLRDEVRRKGISNIEVIGPFDLDQTLPFPNDTFDIVTCRAILNQVQKVKELLLEICRVLRPNGKVNIWVPIFSEAAKDLWTSLSKVIRESHKTDFTYLEIVEMITSNGFEIFGMVPFAIRRNFSERLSPLEDEIMRKRMQEIFLWNKDRLSEINFRWIDDPEELKELKVQNGRAHWFHDFNTIEILAIKGPS